MSPPWAGWADRRLLEVRLCDLHLNASGALHAAHLARVYVELAEKRLRFRPQFWLSDEWFCAVIEERIERCHRFNLKLVSPIGKATLDSTVVLTRPALHSLHSGRHRVAV